MKRLKQSHVSEYRKEMLKDQDGKCAFCGQEAKKPCLDHAHMEPYKDKVRGVLCNWCNIAIGKLENARVRTGTSWGDFALSFPAVFRYIDTAWYRSADWHPAKRKSEVTEFRKLSAYDQIEELYELTDQDIIPTNATERIKLFRKLNNKT